MTDHTPMPHGEKMPFEVQFAFEEAVAKYRWWRSGDEPTVVYQMQHRSISSICSLMTFYENVPLRASMMRLLLDIADERHADLKEELEDNYASASRYLLRLIDDRKDWQKTHGDQ
jgi:hypothetical protein